MEKTPINKGISIKIRCDRILGNDWIILEGQDTDGVYVDVIRIQKTIWDFNKELRLNIVSSVMAYYG